MSAETDIRILFPTNIVQALRGAASPSAANVFATMTDLSSISGFVKTDGTTPLTANWNAGAFTITANSVQVGSAANTISGLATIVNGGGTLTLPTSTSTLATLALAEAFTNKTSYNGLVITANTGAITTGTWAATVIGATVGGTGQTTVTTGDLLYGSASNTWSKLASGATAGMYLRNAGASTAPLWSTLILPNAATTDRIVLATATNTYGESSIFTFNTSTAGTTGIFRASAFDVTSFDADNAYWGSNIFYSGAANVRRAAGYATLVQATTGALLMGHGVTGAANSAVTIVYSARFDPINGAGSLYVGGNVVPTDVLVIGAGSTTVAPIKLISGALTIGGNIRVGQIQFFTDKLYFTITTGTAVKEITLNDAALNSGTIPIATTNGRLTDSGFTSTNLIAGTYAPTFTNVANLDGTPTATTTWQYMRVGNTVTVSGQMIIDPTTTATITQAGISLPIASNFANPGECSGTGSSPSIANQVMAVLGDTTNDRAELQWRALDVTSQTTFVHFTYRII